jgi:hypothetical protein
MLKSEHTVGTQKGADRAVEAVDAVRSFFRKFGAC